MCSLRNLVKEENRGIMLKRRHWWDHWEHSPSSSGSNRDKMLRGLSCLAHRRNGGIEEGGDWTVDLDTNCTAATATGCGLSLIKVIDDATTRRRDGPYYNYTHCKTIHRAPFPSTPRWRLNEQDPMQLRSWSTQKMLTWKWFAIGLLTLNRKYTENGLSVG